MKIFPARFFLFFGFLEGVCGASDSSPKSWRLVAEGVCTRRAEQEGRKIQVLDLAPHGLWYEGAHQDVPARDATDTSNVQGALHATASQFFDVLANQPHYAAVFQHHYAAQVTRRRQSRQQELEWSNAKDSTIHWLAHEYQQHGRDYGFGWGTVEHAEHAGFAPYVLSLLDLWLEFEPQMRLAVVSYCTTVAEEEETAKTRAKRAGRKFLRGSEDFSIPVRVQFDLVTRKDEDSSNNKAVLLTAENPRLMTVERRDNMSKHEWKWRDVRAYGGHATGQLVVLNMGRGNRRIPKTVTHIDDIRSVDVRSLRVTQQSMSAKFRDGKSVLGMVEWMQNMKTSEAVSNWIAETFVGEKMVRVLERPPLVESGREALAKGQDLDRAAGVRSWFSVDNRRTSAFLEFESWSSQQLSPMASLRINVAVIRDSDEMKIERQAFKNSTLSGGESIECSRKHRVGGESIETWDFSEVVAGARLFRQALVAELSRIEASTRPVAAVPPCATTEDNHSSTSSRQSGSGPGGLPCGGEQHSGTRTSDSDGSTGCSSLEGPPKAPGPRGPKVVRIDAPNVARPVGEDCACDWRALGEDSACDWRQDEGQELGGMQLEDNQGAEPPQDTTTFNESTPVPPSRVTKPKTKDSALSAAEKKRRTRQRNKDNRVPSAAPALDAAPECWAWDQNGGRGSDIHTYIRHKQRLHRILYRKVSVLQPGLAEKIMEFLEGMHENSNEVLVAMLDSGSELEAAVENAVEVLRRRREKVEDTVKVLQRAGMLREGVESMKMLCEKLEEALEVLRVVKFAEAAVKFAYELQTNVEQAMEVLRGKVGGGVEVLREHLEEALEVLRRAVDAEGVEEAVEAVHVLQSHLEEALDGLRLRSLRYDNPDAGARLLSTWGKSFTTMEEFELAQADSSQACWGNWRKSVARLSRKQMGEYAWRKQILGDQLYLKVLGTVGNTEKINREDQPQVAGKITGRFLDRMENGVLENMLVSDLVLRQNVEEALEVLRRASSSSSGQVVRSSHTENGTKQRSVSSKELQ